MKKHILALALTLITSLAFSKETINFINPYPPGGGNDQTIQALRPSLERSGYNVETTYLKSCNQAIEMLIKSKNKNDFLIVPNTGISPVANEANCHLDLKNMKDMELMTSVFTGGLYICTAPKKIVSENDLFTKPLKIASVAGHNTRYLKSVLDNTSKPNNITIVPYRGAGDMIRAVNSGDVDLWFSSSLNTMLTPDTVCLGSTFINNPLKIKFLGEYTAQGKKFKEYKTIWLVFTKKVTSDNTKLFKDSLGSQEVKDFILNRSSIHTGILVDPLNKNDINYITSLDEYFMSLPK
jgi:hypothetical protein